MPSAPSYGRARNRHRRIPDRRARTFVKRLYREPPSVILPDMTPPTRSPVSITNPVSTLSMNSIVVILLLIELRHTTSPGIVIVKMAQFELEDVDQLQELVSRTLGGLNGWDMRVTQIERGVFFGSYRSSVLVGEQSRIVKPDRLKFDPLAARFNSVIQNPFMYAAHHKYGRQLHLIGHTPIEFFGLIIPVQENPHVRYQGQLLQSGQIVALTKPNQEVDFITNPGTEFLSVQLGPECAATLVSNLGITEQEQLAQIITSDRRSLQLFKRKIFRLLHHVPAGTDSRGLSRRQGLEAEVIEHLSIMLGSSRPANLNLNQQRCRTIAYWVRDYLDAHLDRPVGIEEICAVFELRPRTLHYAFKSCFGVSPVMYHRFRRMQLVRAHLLVRDPANPTVTQLATDHGFFHLGRFATDYKAVFGETPAHTLAKRA